MMVAPKVLTRTARPVAKVVSPPLEPPATTTATPRDHQPAHPPGPRPRMAAPTRANLRQPASVCDLSQGAALMRTAFRTLIYARL